MQHEQLNHASLPHWTGLPEWTTDPHWTTLVRGAHPCDPHAGREGKAIKFLYQVVPLPEIEPFNSHNLKLKNFLPSHGEEHSQFKPKEQGEHLRPMQRESNWRG
jgi:hypothetical protein